MVSLATPHAFLASHSRLLSPGARERYDAKAHRFAKVAGFTLARPMPTTASIGTLTGRQLGLAQARSIDAQLRAAHVVVVDLMPQRGVHALPSVAYWLGLARGLGKPVFGFTATTHDLVRRAVQHFGGAHRNGVHTDGKSGLVLEDFGMLEEAALEDAFEANSSRLLSAVDLEDGLALAFTEARRWVDAQRTAE